MSLIKKIKQFINGSWQEFSLNSGALDNVVTLDQEEMISAVKTFSGSVNENSFPISGLTRIAGNRIAVGGPIGNGAYMNSTEFAVGVPSGTRYRNGAIVRERPTWRSTLNFPTYYTFGSDVTETLATQEWVNGVVAGKVDYLGVVGSTSDLSSKLEDASFTPTAGDYCRANNTFNLIDDMSDDGKGEEIHPGDILVYTGADGVIADATRWDIIHTEDPGTILNIVNGIGSGSLQQKGYVSQDGYTTLGAIASGEGAVAFGGQSFDKVGSPVSEEPQTEAKGKQSFAAGGGVLVSGNWSAGFGKDNIVDGKAAFSVGGGNIIKEVLDNDGNVSYSFSIALGESNEVHGRSSVALGSTNHLEKFGSYAIGYGNKIYGKQSGALGTGNQIDAENATSIGHSNFIHDLHNFSTLIGTGLRSNNKYQTVSGRFNAPSDGVFVVGNGNNADDRKNAFIVMEDGRAKVYGTPTEDNDVVRKQDISTTVDQEFFNSLY